MPTNKHRPHWLPKPGKTTTPNVTCCIATIADTEITATGESMTLRGWGALIRLRGLPIPPSRSMLSATGQTPAELADTIEDAVAIGDSAWVFGHDVGLDLALTDLPAVLEGRGWQPRFVHIGDESCIFSLKRDSGSILITDAWSWLRSPLHDAAADVRRSLPDNWRTGGGADDWRALAKRAVTVLDGLIQALLGWWDTQNAGGFGATASSCGWRTMRMLVPERTVIVGPDPARTPLERAALYGGRKEVFHVGQVSHRHIDDWDLHAAHLTAVASLPLPTMPVRDDRVRMFFDPLDPPEQLATICRVRVQTDVPCAPCRIAGDIWWPVGTFETALTSIEAHYAVECGARLKCLEAQWYRLTDALQPWGRWCLDLLENPAVDVPAVVRRVAKGWGRSVPGRFALLTSQLISERPATAPGWGLETGTDIDTGAAIDILTYGGVERTYRRDQDGPDVNPAVLAFVEAHVRVATGKAIRSRPAGSVLQVNTDGWWEIRPGRSATADTDLDMSPWRLVRKSTHNSVTVRGPDHIEAPGDRRLAGVPATAEQRADGSFAWRDWPGLRWQLQFSRPGVYMRPGKTLRLGPHYCRRWVLENGSTLPIAVGVDGQGGSRILPWSKTAGHGGGRRLASVQHATLRPLSAV